MGYRIAVDIGGTFTDCVIVDDEGARTIAKSLTTPGRLEQGVLDAVTVGAEMVGCTPTELLERTDLFVHGTTQATNAMLTRNGARTGLLTTKGHEDTLVIGRVYSKTAGLPERDVVHASRLAKPRPIVPPELVCGVTERIDRDGDVIVALDESEVAMAIDRLLAADVEAIAVSLLWSFVNDVHERRIKEILTERAPAVFATFSHEVAPVLGEYERTATTAVNAYIGPKVAGYLTQLESRLQNEGLPHPLLVMQASGGLTSVLDAAKRPIVTLDSGPTGGILGCQHVGRLYEEPNLICTDVGGTSFDVGLILDERVPLDAEPVIGQYVLRTPKVLVESIGSGGGSLAWIDDGGLLRVGPQSAGSRPGPACYGLGGTEPTVTDADLVLGYLDGEAFLGGRMRLDRDLALRALERLGQGLGMSAEEVAIGIFRIINSQMADLIRKSTIEQGHDPRECVLVAYGGAGPTHAAFYGHDIGSKGILILSDSTVFSAEGMLTCNIAHAAQVSRRVTVPLDDHDLAAMTERFDALERQVLEQFRIEGAPVDEVVLERTLGVRYGAQVYSLEVPVDRGRLTQESAERVIERFHRRYAQVYGDGALLEGGGIEAELHRVTGIRRIDPIAFPRHELQDGDPSAALTAERPVYFEGMGFSTTPVYNGEALQAGNVVSGPALIQRMGDSVTVPPGFVASVDSCLTLVLTPADIDPARGNLTVLEAAR